MYGHRAKGLLECAQISSVIKVIPFVGILQGGSSFAKCRLEEEGRSDVKSRLRQGVLSNQTTVATQLIASKKGGLRRGAWRSDSYSFASETVAERIKRW